MNPRPPVAIAKWLGLGYAAALAALWLLEGNHDGLEMLVVGLVSYFWQVGPAAIAAVLAKASRTAPGAWAFLSLEAAVMISTAWFWYALSFVHPDPQNPIGLLLVLPFSQYLAVTAFLLLAALLGWRIRESWLERLN